MNQLHLRRQMSVSDDPFFSQPYVASSEANQTIQNLIWHTPFVQPHAAGKNQKPVAAAVSDEQEEVSIDIMMT